MHLALYQSRKLPTDSADEPDFVSERVLSEMKRGRTALMRMYHWPDDSPLDVRVDLVGFDDALTFVRERLSNLNLGTKP